MYVLKTRLKFTYRASAQSVDLVHHASTIYFFSNPLPRDWLFDNVWSYNPASTVFYSFHFIFSFFIILWFPNTTKNFMTETNEKRNW